MSGVPSSVGMDRDKADVVEAVPVEPARRSRAHDVMAAPEHALITATFEHVSVTMRKSTIRRGIRCSTYQLSSGKQAVCIEATDSSRQYITYMRSDTMLLVLKLLTQGLLCAINGEAPPSGVVVVWHLDEPTFICCGRGWPV